MEPLHESVILRIKTTINLCTEQDLLLILTCVHSEMKGIIITMFYFILFNNVSLFLTTVIMLWAVYIRERTIKLRIRLYKDKPQLICLRKKLLKQTYLLL